MNKGSGKMGQKKASIGGGSTDKANKVLQNNFLKKNSGSDVPEFSRKANQQTNSNFQKAAKSNFANNQGGGSKPRKQEDKKPKFKMEVDLSALNGRVHFADDEKFMIPS